MTTHRISKGFDIRIAGQPEARLVDVPDPDVVAVRPTDFPGTHAPGMKAKLLVAEGDEVATGQPLFLDKNDPEIVFCSPMTGVVKAAELGARRALLQVVVERKGTERFFDGPKVDVANLAGCEPAALIAALKGAGLWPLLCQRPLARIARSEKTPVAIYVNGMDTEPLAADPAFAVQGSGDDLKLGLRMLARLTSGKVYLTVRDGSASKEFDGAAAAVDSVEQHRFSGPHPAGLVGTHIAAIQPLKDGETAWYLKAQDAVLLGQWLRTGHYPAHRVVAVAGTRAPERRYVRVRQGAPLVSVLGGTVGDDVRCINGTVLSGTAEPADGNLGFYAHTVTAMPDGEGERDLFGWALPQFGRHSASRSVWSWLTPKKEYDLDARLHGGPRGMVNLGQMESVMALDVYPTFLCRAIQAGDLEEALSLGLLDVAEDDVALCTFVDPSKLDVGSVIREGLDLYEREG